MQSTGEPAFRDKVFDQNVLTFCLEIIDLLEKMPHQPQLLRRVVLDAVAVSSSLQEVSVFVKSLNTLSLKDFAPHMEGFLDACAKIRGQGLSLDELLTTIRHLSSRPDFKEWEGLFRSIAIVGDEPELLSEFFTTLRASDAVEKSNGKNDLFAVTRIYGSNEEAMRDVLMTVRHLAEQKGFQEWDGFFAALKVLGETAPSTVKGFLMGIRHLAGLQEFSSWADIFAVVRIHGGDERTLEDFMTTVRHLAALPDFKEWDAFFIALKILSEKPATVMVNVLEAVRHAIQYFSTGDSLKSVFRMLSATPQYSEACAYGQLDSKKWLVEEAQKVWGKDWGTVFVLAGWVGFLPRFLFDAGIGVKTVRSFDIDPEAGPAAELLNQTWVQKDWIFKSSTFDITQLKYPATFPVRRKDGTTCELFETPDVVINTSCEHLADIDAWWAQIPPGTKVILQSNDAFYIPEHVKCFKTLGDFEAAMGLSKIDYRGELRLADFNRFMLIGIK